MGIFTIEWLEDLDLSGGSAAVALGLIAGKLGPYTRSTADIAVGPPGDNNRIVGAIACNETVSNSAATFSVEENTRSPYSIGGIESVELSPTPSEMQLGLDIKIPDKAHLGFLGIDGAGAEQSACVLYIEKPDMEDPWRFSPANAWDEVISVLHTTNARVLNTISGHVNILGRDNPYTGGQTPIPTSREVTIQIIKIIAQDVAGYSGPCLVRAGTANLMFPCAATHTVVYDMMEMFGGYPTCPGDDPFDIAGVGVTTAPMTLSGTVLGINYGSSRT